MNQKNPALLPSGFVDLLPPDAEREANAIAVLMETFASFGYQRVKPPLLEFEDSLFAPGPGASMASTTFRVMDPVSHRMMGVRSDITPQIARISSSRLEKEARPLRVCYANDVLRTSAGQQRIERQFTQVGCEIIGEKNIEADIESCVVALIALDDLGLKSITIDLAYPRIVTSLLDQNKISESQRDVIKHALERKSADGLSKAPKKLAEILKKLMGASGVADKSLKKLAAIPQIKNEVRQLQQVYAGVQKAVHELGLKNIQVTIDPVEMRGFKYYSGMGFTLFSKNIAGALGRGGHYDIHFGGKKGMETASGFTLYMDTVRKAMPPAKSKKTVRAGYGENWKKLREQQRKGIVVVRGKGKA